MTAYAADPSPWTHRMVTATVVLATLSFAVADGAALLGVMVLPLLVFEHRLMRKPWYARVPRWALNGLLVVVAAIAAFVWASADVLVSQFARFLIAVLLVKMLDRRKASDEGQLLTISVFMVLATVLTNVGLFVGVMLLIMVPLLIDAAVRVQIMVAAESCNERHVAYGDRPPHKRINALATIGVVGISIVVFLIIPRQLIDGRFGNLRSPSGSATLTGFTDQVRLGSRGIISESPEPVLDLRLEDVNGNSLGGQNEIHYLRGAVLDHYDMGRWTDKSGSGREWRRKLTAGLSDVLGPAPRRDIATLVQHIVLRNADPIDQVLFSVWRPYRVRLAESGSIRLKPAGVVHVMGGSGQLSYTTWSSQIDLRHEGLRRDPVERLDLPRLNAWARQVLIQAEIEPDPELRDVDTDGRAARALESAVRGMATYTLDQPPIPPDADPTEWFLFEAKRGHCEYFASALAAACRAVGIDSRVVAGYVAAEFNETGRYYLVRQSNAHAWVEVDIGGEVWISLDPTPPADLRSIHSPQPTMLTRINRFVQALEYAWVTRVVDFGGNKPWAQPGPDRGPRSADSTAPTSTPDINWVAWGLPLVILAAGVGVVMFAIRLLRRRRGRSELTGLWSELDSLLRHMGRQCPRWQGRLDHARSLRPDINPEASDALERFVLSMYEHRFTHSDAPTLDECRKLLERFRASIADSRTPRAVSQQ